MVRNNVRKGAGATEMASRKPMHDRTEMVSRSRKRVQTRAVSQKEKRDRTKAGNRNRKRVRTGAVVATASRVANVSKATVREMRVRAATVRRVSVSRIAVAKVATNSVSREAATTHPATQGRMLRTGRAANRSQGRSSPEITTVAVSRTGVGRRTDRTANVRAAKESRNQRKRNSHTACRGANGKHMIRFVSKYSARMPAVGVILILCLGGCGKRAVCLSADTDPRGWEAGEDAVVGYENRDTVSLRDLSVFIKHRKDFSKQVDSIVLNVAVISPDSLVFNEAVTVFPTSGGHRGYSESKHIYRRRVRFPREGTYKFAVSHTAARPIEGVAAVGIEITKSNGQR